MYGCKKIHLQTGLLWNRRNQNAGFSGAVLSDTGVTSNIGRNPYDHDTHIRYAGNVISSYDGKYIRHRRRLCHGWNPGDNSLLDRDVTVCILGAAVYLKQEQKQ